MCRISGIINPNYNFELAISQVEKMCLLQKHGGPDDEGIYINEEDKLILGHRRLSLLDLSSAGHQPMHFKERYTISYNGEIYNYQSLKKTLIELGYTFKTNTDTEVVLAAFAKWNTNAFAKFNGMFAFALYDNLEKKIFLVRDAAGIKPLYYTIQNDCLIFASELKAFSVIENLQEKNKAVPILQMAYGHIPEPNTIYSNVQPLQKGCYFSYNINSKKQNLQMFHFFSFKNEITNKNEILEKVNQSVSNAVKCQMESDAPIGVFLSGGIDSSIIASLANIELVKNLHTLSIYFEEKKYSEKKYQDLMAEKLNSHHHSILLTEKDFHQNFSTIINDMDSPSCDGINTWFISKYAADAGLKAVLSGIGADELYGGYPSFDRTDKALAMQNLPKVLLKSSSKFAFKKYDRITYLQIEGARGLYLFLRGHYTPNEIAKHLGTYEKDIWQTLKEVNVSPNINLGNKNLASWLEFNYYMQDQLLKDADIMSMAHGLEIRVPFLDYNVIDVAFSVKEKIKFDAVTKKSLLIEAFSNNIPNDIWKRPKMGFSFPFVDWMKNNEEVKSLANNKNTIALQSYNDFLKGNLHWSKIMSLVVLNQKQYLA